MNYLSTQKQNVLQLRFRPQGLGFCVSSGSWFSPVSAPRVGPPMMASRTGCLQMSAAKSMLDSAWPRHSVRDHPASVLVGQRSVSVERILSVVIRSCRQRLLGPRKSRSVATQAQHRHGDLARRGDGGLLENPLRAVSRTAHAVSGENRRFRAINAVVASANRPATCSHAPKAPRAPPVHRCTPSLRQDRRVPESAKSKAARTRARSVPRCRWVPLSMTGSAPVPSDRYHIPRAARHRLFSFSTARSRPNRPRPQSGAAIRREPSM